MRKRTARRHTPGPSISDSLDAEHRERTRAAIPSPVTTPPPQKRFGLRRLKDGELVAHGPLPALRKLKETLGGDAHRLVRLAKVKRRAPRTAVAA